MLKDYYRNLEIPRDASIADIKAAYRRRAMECHPDRGGSHAAMLEINEAFEILSDPRKRQEYDVAWTHHSDLKAQRRAAHSADQARQNAANYPRRWAEFEIWLNAVTEDFRRAQYSRTKDGIPMPTAGGSITGWVFIVGGAIGGYVLFTLFGDSDHPGAWGMRMFIVCVAGGAWLGRWLHEAVGVRLGNSREFPVESRRGPRSKLQRLDPRK